MPGPRHHPEYPRRTLCRCCIPSPRPERKSAFWSRQSHRRSLPNPGTRSMPRMAGASFFSCSTPLPDRVAAAFHAGAIGPIEGIDLFLVLSHGLLVLGLLVLAGATASGHGADDRADGGALARITGNPADDCPARSAAQGTSRTFATTHRRPRGLRRRGLRHDGWIDAGVLLGPHVALAIVLALLRRALPFRGIGEGLLRHGRAGQAEGREIGRASC